MRRASMSDVAKQANVSKATVSHVINGTRFVEEETRQRVLAVIQSLGYRPNFLARSLTTKRTGIIGIVISDSSNYFFGEMLKGVQERLLPDNYGLIVCNTNETLELESHYLNLLLGLNVDGIITAAASRKWGELSEAELQHTPVIYVDRKFDNMKGPFIGVDNIGGACMGVKYLIELGYKKIGCLAGFDRLSSMRERVEGYKKALLETGTPFHEEWTISSDLSIEAGQQGMIQLLSLTDHPDAVFINNNLLGLGALLAIKEMKLNCPKDIAIVCFDDHPWAPVSDPPLTVIKQPAYQLGILAAETLLDWIYHGKADQKNTILSCELVVRKSAMAYSSLFSLNKNIDVG